MNVRLVGAVRGKARRFNNTCADREQSKGNLQNSGILQVFRLGDFLNRFFTFVRKLLNLLARTAARRGHIDPKEICH